MNINILITGGLYSRQGGYSALQFCRAAVTQGHTISQVFFYQDGVTHGNRLFVPMSDEPQLVEDWSQFSRQHDTPLVVCVSAAERRGVLNEEQAAEYGKDSNNLHPQFSVAGLGVFHEASLESDRTVSFK